MLVVVQPLFPSKSLTLSCIILLLQPPGIFFIRKGYSDHYPESSVEGCRAVLRRLSEVVERTGTGFCRRKRHQQAATAGSTQRDAVLIQAVVASIVIVSECLG